VNFETNGFVYPVDSSFQRVTQVFTDHCTCCLPVTVGLNHFGGLGNISNNTGHFVVPLKDVVLFECILMVGLVLAEDRPRLLDDFQQGAYFPFHRCEAC